jgi:hypothetical protein
MSRSLLRIAALSLLLVPAVALAAAPAELWINCNGLAGCPSGWEEHFSSVLTLLLARMPVYVYGLGVLFIMIGGAYMILSAGDAEKVTRGKNTITWAVIGIFVMQASQSLVNFVTLEATTMIPGSDLVTSATNTLIGSIFDLLYVAILGVAIFSGMRMVVAFGKEEQFNKGKEGLLWAAVGAIVINLADAIATAFNTL